MTSTYLILIPYNARMHKLSRSYAFVTSESASNLIYVLTFVFHV